MNNERGFVLHVAEDKQERSYVSPNDEFEGRLVDICKTVLRIEKIGMKDNLFYLGAESLQIVVILQEVQSTFFVDVPIIDVVDMDTVEELSDYIRKNGGVLRDEKYSLIAKIENMSEAEIDNFLSHEKSQY